jgi:hypothetical protein
MTVRANPGFHAICFRFAVSANDNGATRVVLSNLYNKLRILFQ